jgi:ATP-binding cassette, subfamily B, bacterial
MGFVMDGLDAEAYDRTYSDRDLVRRIAGYFRPHGRIITIVGGMVALATLVETVIPVAISRGIDLLAGNPAAQLVLALAGGIAVLGSLGWIFNYVRQSLAARAVGDVVLKLREDAFAAVMQRDLSFYDQFASGKIVSRVTSDTQDFSTVVTLTIDLISQFLLVLVITIVLFTIDTTLGLLVLAVTPLVFIVALSFRRLARGATLRGQRATAEVNSAIQETISGIAVAKSFRQESAIYADFAKTNQLAYRVRLVRGLVMGTIFPSLDIISGLTVALIVYFGGRRALAGTISTGEWFLFVQTLNIFLYPMTSIASFWSQFQQGLSASERVFALVDADPKVTQTASEPVGRLKGRISFERVQFRYGERSLSDRPPLTDDGRKTIDNGAEANDPSQSTIVARRSSGWVLPDFSLDIPAGQTVAVVGHTGAGKSSLARLIMRFYEFQGGRRSEFGRPGIRRSA